ncbi:hypothetical protein CEP54_014452 [Fusarium duplospermum]|uniref:Flavin-containing monooxygenase n=1 Tax=Fusarium duplospermum TaxID=1325734 RepID=A0A428NWB7_9HYPO|nr:hypothetical protein CEP54_014452 [Fusarium duplospermum]
MIICTTLSTTMRSPTTDILGIEIPADADPQKEAQGIVDDLSKVLAKGDAQGFADLFLDYGVWRDKLSFTWDYRTFNFKPAILKAATDLFSTTKTTNFKFLTPAPKIDRPYPDYAQLQFIISFETDALKQFPEIPPADGHMTGAISWENQRAQDVDSIDPEVLIIGGGQNGLALAARLNALGMKNLIIDHSEEIGAVWKNRYEYFSLHFPHWAEDLPYFPYPKHWPTYTPSQKQGVYMQWYASALELNVWTKSSVAKAEQDEQGNWTVMIDKEGKEARTLHPKQVVMATSLCGTRMLPDVPGMTEFKGTIRHPKAHDSSRDFIRKKVCGVGTSSSGFDTAYDCARRGLDVTLLQRSPTYIMSLTHSVPRIIGNYGPDADQNRPDLEEQDRLFFATPTGPREEFPGATQRFLRTLTVPYSMLCMLVACAHGVHIINGNIKVKPGYIERFTEYKVILSGGREHDFDLVVFATGFTNTIDSLGDKIADKVTPIWGIDDEGEFKTAFRETGVPNLWIFVGYLPYTRFHSKLLAMRLKALKEGVSQGPYTA